MLIFSRQDFTARLHNETETLLDLLVKTQDKDEATRLFDKRSAVEEALAHWFRGTIDMDDVSAKAWLIQLEGFLNLKLDSPVPPSFGKREGYHLVLSFIEEY